MEVMVVSGAVVAAIAALSIAIAVFVKVVKLQPPQRPLQRLASTRGFPWLMLGLAATFVYGLLGLSLIMPLLVTTGGAAAVIVGLLKKDNH